MPRWTPEARERQRQAIQRWKPWKHSTGPTSDYGKQVSSRNSYYCTQEWQQLKAINLMLKIGLGGGMGVDQLDLAIKGFERVLKNSTKRDSSTSLSREQDGNTCKVTDEPCPTLLEENWISHRWVCGGCGLSFYEIDLESEELPPSERKHNQCLSRAVPPLWFLDL